MRERKGGLPLGYGALAVVRPHHQHLLHRPPRVAYGDLEVIPVGDGAMAPLRKAQDNEEQSIRTALAQRLPSLVWSGCLRRRPSSFPPGGLESLPPVTPGDREGRGVQLRYVLVHPMSLHPTGDLDRPGLRTANHRLRLQQYISVSVFIRARSQLTRPAG